MYNYKYAGIAVAYLFAVSGGASATCFHENGTCYGVGTAAFSSGLDDQFSELDGVTSSFSTITVGDNQASAGVDLTDGKVRVLAYSGAGASSNGWWLESVKFDLPDGFESMIIPIKIRLDGYNTDKFGYSTHDLYMGFQMASYGGAFDHSDSFIVVRQCGIDADFAEAVCKEGAVSIEFNYDLTVWEDAYYGISNAINVFNTNYFQDFSSTSAFSWILPDGVTYISGSGVFLSALPSSVPEPKTWVFMVLGFGLIGKLLRQHVRIKLE